MKRTNAQLAQLSFERAQLYAFFSRIFSEEVDAPLLEILRERCLVLAHIEHDEKVGISTLRSFFKDIEISVELVEDLREDFVALFLGTGNNPAFPYESVYMNENRLVMGLCREEVLELLDSESLQKDKRCKEPEDHISVLFDFMVYLCLRLKEELNRGDTEAAEHTLSIQNNFYHKHIVTWTDMFCRTIIEGSTRHRFYESIGRMLQSFLLDEKNMFDRFS